MPATQARASLKRLGGRLPQGRMREMKLNQKMVALVIGHSDTWNNAMIYVSEHQTIDFQCPIPNAQKQPLYINRQSLVKTVWSIPDRVA